jgi:hypothetical protein
MTHPNCSPTPAMRNVCMAAQRAAERNDTWVTKSSSDLRGIRGKKHRRVVRFNVTFGGGTRAFYLTKGGVLLYYSTDGMYPIELASFTDSQCSVIQTALNTISR